MPRSRAVEELRLLLAAIEKSGVGYLYETTELMAEKVKGFKRSDLGGAITRARRYVDSLGKDSKREE